MLSENLNEFMNMNGRLFKNYIFHPEWNREYQDLPEVSDSLKKALSEGEKETKINLFREQRRRDLFRSRGGRRSHIPIDIRKFIIEEIREGKEGRKSLARKYGVSEFTIQEIKRKLF